MWLQHTSHDMSHELTCLVEKVECRDRYETYAKGLVLPFIFDRPQASFLIALAATLGFCQ